MAVVFMTDPATGRCALYDEAPGGGAFDNPNSSRNRPLNSPTSWLANLYFHSDFDYMEVSHGPTNVVVNHAQVVPGTQPADANINFGWYATGVDRLLLTHNLGYLPIAMVAYQNNLIWPGMPVQVQGDGGARFVSFYVTTTQVRLYEFASVVANTLVAAARTYTVLVFRRPPAPSGDILLDFNASTGILKMGRDKFISSRRYLQVVPGGTPFGIAHGRTIDLKNGAPRAVRPDGTTYNPVPAALKFGINRPNFPTVYGASMAYNGNFVGPGSIEVQAP